MGIISKIIGTSSERFVKKLEPLVLQINEKEPEIQKLKDSQLKEKMSELRKFVAEERENGREEEEILNEILPEVFALVREAGKRTLKQRHYDVQLIGGIVLHQGKIAEMKTGEGKTLVATLPATLNALTGKGVHIVTVNDYLAKRDCQWMGHIYNMLGLTVSSIQHEKAYRFVEETGDVVLGEENNLSEITRKEAYACDICYGTNNEFGFDYLRDNMVSDLSEMAQRDLSYAIVDEVDSILIDEARTPLIISAPAEEATEKYYQFARLIAPLKKNEDFDIDEKMKATTFTENGQNKVVQSIGKDPWAENDIATTHQLESALKAKTLFEKDRDYVVKDGEVTIVDEFTGRLMLGRRYSEGLHQAIEAKEGVEIKKESITLATITFQNYFRMYKKLAGMTGTAFTEQEEFYKIYKLDVIVIPTNKELIRTEYPDLIYKTEKGKFNAVVSEIKQRHEAGQPILVGTTSIERNELLDDLLTRNGVPHEVLNAKNHEREAQIIAQAGKKGAVTVATNMAGRGVDIILSGTPPDKKQASEIIELGGLHVVGTERHESRRIDNQLRGRAGRQGDPGSSQFFVSTEDDLMRIFAADRIAGVMETLNLPEDQPIGHSMISRALESAQKKVEGQNFDIRKHLLEYDDVINKHRETIYRRRRKVLNAAQSDKKDEKGVSVLKKMVLEYISNEIEKLVQIHTEIESKESREELSKVINTIIPLDDKIKKEIFDSNNSDELIQALKEKAYNIYEAKEKEIGYDGMRLLEKAVLLRSIDNLWIEHLEALDALKEGVGLRGYGQRDPLVEFKGEAYGLFKKLLSGIQSTVTQIIYKASIVQNQQSQSPMEKERQQETRGNWGDGENVSSSTATQPASTTKQKQKVGRNDPCPCGSGKKFKKCCGR
jgi:preprotein translocase subunit SecA